MPPRIPIRTPIESDPTPKCPSLLVQSDRIANPAHGGRQPYPNVALIFLRTTLSNHLIDDATLRMDCAIAGGNS